MTMTTQTPMPAPNPGPAQTALMPLDPTVSPLQSLRILPIRADLLPEEISAGRNARRIRTLLVAALVLTLVVLAGWYMLAVKDRDAAEQDLTAVSQQVDRTRKETQRDQYTKVTAAIDVAKTITAQLKTAMADDLPWYTLLDQLRKTGVANVSITNVSGTLEKNIGGTAPAGGTPAAGAAATTKAGTVTVTGTAKDKKTIAAYVDSLADANLVTNVYLTAGTEQKEKGWSFTLTAEVPKSALCGRFGTPCKSGGK